MTSLTQGLYFHPATQRGAGQAVDTSLPNSLVTTIANGILTARLSIFFANALISLSIGRETTSMVDDVVSELTLSLVLIAKVLRNDMACVTLRR